MTQAQPWLVQMEALSRRYLGGRPIAHLTPRYIADRSRVWLYQRRHADAPWLTADAIAILSTALRKSDNGVEWGSGRSTTWFAQRTHSLLSIETSQTWHGRVSQTIKQLGLNNVTYKYIPADQRIAHDPYKVPYIEADPGLTPGSLDYALVDGSYREDCALKVLDLLKPGSLLIVDNVDWFISYSAHSLAAIPAASQHLWATFLSRVAPWRLIWTHNGVWSTAIWIKTSPDERGYNAQ